MSGFDDNYASLVDDDGGNLEHLRDTTGLIHTTTFYTTSSATETTPGSVRGLPAVLQASAQAKTARPSRRA